MPGVISNVGAPLAGAQSGADARAGARSAPTMPGVISNVGAPLAGAQSGAGARAATGARPYNRFAPARLETSEVSKTLETSEVSSAAPE